MDPVSRTAQGSTSSHGAPGDSVDAAVRDSVERYRALFESIDDGFCVLQMLFDEEENPVDYRFLEVNPTFEQHTGLIDAQGRTARELVPDLDPSWFKIYGQVAQTGESVRFENYAPAMARWFDVYAFRIGPPQNREVALLFKNITERKWRELNNALLDELQAVFALPLSAEEIMQRSGEMIARHLDVSSVSFAEINEAEDEATITFHRRSESVPVALGAHRLADFLSDDYVRQLNAGQTVAVDDVRTHPLTAELAEAYLPFGILSQIHAPYRSDGRWKFVLTVQHDKPRVWRTDEVDLLRALSARLWLRLERAATDAALRRERDLVRTIAENSTSALVMMDERGYCTYANRALLRMTGFSAEEIRSKPLHDLIHHHYPDGRPYPKDACPIDRALPENFDIRAHEDLFFRKDGSSFPVLCAASPIFDSGRPVSTVIEIRDITAEKEAEAALRESEQRFRDMADTAPAMLWVTDSENVTTFLSRGWFDYTGQSEEEGLGFGWLKAVHPDDREDAARRFMLAAAARTPISIDFRLRRRTGEYRWVLDEGRPQYDEQGTWRGYIGAVIDVHDRKMATEALRESENRLRELSRSLEERVAERTEALQKQSARLRHLAAELASAEQRERKRLAALLHDDLQQLLFAAAMQLGYFISQVDGEVAPALDEAAHRLDEAVEVARNLTRQLRPPALYEAGLLPALEWLASEMGDRHHLSVAIDAARAEPPLNDDVKALLFECIRELLFNTVKYAGVDRAFVKVWDEDDLLHVVVRDDGCGFEVESSLGAYQNGGFGLFSVRERVAALGGSVTIDSAPGRGTRVALRLPIQQPSLLAESDATLMEVSDTGRPAESSSATSTQPRQIRVFVVDDHVLVREGIANLLRSNDRLVVVGEAGDGIEALDALEQEQPDVVLVDLNMPRMNGIETTREIVRRWPEMTVIGLSVQGDGATAKSMLEAGALAFVPKSGDSQDMIDTILRLSTGDAGPAG